MDRWPTTLDPVLRAAAYALALNPQQTEFGVLARIPDGQAIQARPGIRFGHAVLEADGTVLPPREGPPRADGALFATLRIDLLGAAGAEAGEREVNGDLLMRDLLTKLQELEAEGWNMQVQRLAGSPFSASMEALHARPADLEGLGLGAPDGTGVLVGAVDFGCAFAHPAFRLGADGLGGTRLRMLWDQNGRAAPGASLPGRFYAPAEIDALLARPDPYAAGGYVPWENGYVVEDTGAVHVRMSETDRRAQVHGTHVLSVAAGRRPAEGAWARPVVAGVAPAAALGFVHLRPRALVSEGDAVDVLDGVCALFDLAARGGMPAVVNLSIGANTGAHDGQGLMERAFDALLQAPGRAITVAAGNARDKGLHRSAEVGRPLTLGWRFQAGDSTVNMLRVYAPMQEGMPALELSLGWPGSMTAEEVAAGGMEDAMDRPGPLRRIGGQAAVILRPEVGTGLIGTAVATTLPPGTEAPVQHFEIRLRPSGAEETWWVTLGLLPGGAAARWGFDAWIERDDLRPNSGSRFAPPQEPNGAGCSLGSLACAEGPICVGAYALPGGKAASFSSCGRTRSGGEKPDLAAPGIGVPGASGLGGLRDADGLTQRASVAMDGTSAAAPQVAGIVALMLQLRPRLSAARIREILCATTAERQADPGAAWDHALGHGRVDARAALAMVMGEPE